jgi:hypothetical protein
MLRAAEAVSREATNTFFIVFGLTQSGLEPTIYRNQGEHAHQYTTDAILSSLNLSIYFSCISLIRPHPTKATLLIRLDF